MRKLATAAAVGLALASNGAFALGLGDIDMQSALNQPMNAEIPLTAVQAGELDGMIVQLADEDAFARAGIERSSVLTDLSFTVDRSGARPVIRVTSPRAVTEPFLNFLLEVDWPQGRMVREYTVLLDPPVFMTQGPSVRDGGADRPAVTGGDSAVVAPAPIERDGGFEVELVDGDDELADEALLGGSDVGGDVVSLDGLTGGSADDGGDIVSLTDLDAPNTDAAAERAARAAGNAARGATAPDELFEVELVGDGVEVGDDAGGEDRRRAGAAGADGGDVVSLDGLTDPSDARAPAASGGDAPDEITVTRGDTLFTIAEPVTPSGTSVQQMMLALLEANRSAFINDNINLVKAGSILRVPRAAEAQALSQAQALAEIGRQDDLWRDYRDNLRGSTAGTRIASGPSEPAAGDDVDATELADAEAGLSDEARAILEAARNEVRGRDELSIVADDTTATTTASATADETDGNDGARLGEINRRLQLAREELAATRVEGDDLGEQADELQSTSENLDALVSLRQNEIAKLEAQLADARDRADAQGGDVVGDVADAATGSVADASGAAGDAASAAGEAVAGVGESAAGAVAAAGDAASGAASDAGDVLADAGDAISGAAAGAADEAGRVANGAVDATGDALEGAAADTGNALSAAGTELESVELVGADTDADGALTPDTDVRAAAATAATAADDPWYQNLFGDPTRLAIIGAGVLGLFGVLGTLLWRRRRQDDDDPLAGFHDDDVEFIDDDEANDLQAEVDAQTVSRVGTAPAVDLDGDGAKGGFGGAGAAAAAGVAGVAGAAAAGAASFGSNDDDDTVDTSAEAALDKDDTISEVDVYLAYGLHGQAEELLVKAVDRQPENMEYAEKLLQTYHAQGNGEGFRRLAEDYHARFGGDSNPAWADIAAMGRELRPNETLFAAAAGAGVAAVGSGQLGGAQLDDEDFLAGAGDGETGSSSISRDFGAAEDALDFESTDSMGSFLDADDDTAATSLDDEDESALMDQSLDPAFAFGEGDLEATGDFSKIAEELSAESDDGSLDFPGFEADAGTSSNAAEADAGDATAEPSPFAGLPDVPEEHSLDDAMTLDELDLDSTSAIAANDTRAVGDELSLDLDDLAGAVDLDATSVDGTGFLDDVEGLGGSGDAEASLAADDLGSLDIGDLTGAEGLADGTGAPLDDTDEMDTMMDLAKAYIDMGDKDSASNALGEIVKGGNPEQVSEAETLLRKIS